MITRRREGDDAGVHHMLRRGAGGLAEFDISGNLVVIPAVRHSGGVFRPESRLCLSYKPLGCRFAWPHVSA
jgi:hypothetical protein